VLHDPNARRAYILTKAAVFAVAAAATWPLAKVFGAGAWWGLGAFGLALLIITVIVLFAGSAERGPASDEGAEEEEEEEEEFAEDRPVTLPVEDRIDLHPFEPREIPEVVVDYLVAAHARGFREVRLIHGRGIGVQRERVRSVLARHPLVEEFHDAPADRGGWGATVAYLKRG
jgi:hypothetical protein